VLVADIVPAADHDAEPVAEGEADAEGERDVIAVSVLVAEKEGDADKLA
jgi:hypothetical protein